MLESSDLLKFETCKAIVKFCFSTLENNSSQILNSRGFTSHEKKEKGAGNFEISATLHNLIIVLMFYFLNFVFTPLLKSTNLPFRLLLHIYMTYITMSI